MKNKLITVIIILILCIVGLSIYKFGFYKNDNEQHYFNSIKITNYKENENESDILDNITYKGKIINEKVTSIEYSFFHDSKSITGDIYIGKDKYLYITDDNKNSTYRVSTTKFETIYSNGYEYISGVYVWLLSESNIPYIMYLESNDITKAEVNALADGRKYTNFVDISYNNDRFETGYTVFLLSESGNIYDISSGLRYNKDVISLYGEIYVYQDNIFVNSDGMLFQDKNGNNYKIKYVFDTFENNKFIPDNQIILVTEDNKFIYLGDDLETVYEFSKKVTDVSFDVYYPYVEGNLKVTFEDGYNVELKASCNQYFCVNDFAE